MQKKTILFGILIFLVVISMFSSTAIVKKGNPFFNLTQTSFGPGNLLEGIINFSLENELGNTPVRTMISGEIIEELNLIDFLEKVETTHTCNPENCEVTYDALTPGESKTINLVNEEKYLGFVAKQTNPQIINLTFRISGTSSADPVCGETPIKFDLLADNEIEFEYKKAADSWCSELRPSTCYNFGQASESSEIGSTPYCQRISLNKTGKLNVSASIRYISGELGDNDIQFLIYDKQGNLKDSCNVEYFDANYFSLATCIVGLDEYLEPTDFYISEQGEHFVCVQNTGSAIYEIKKESQEPLCGMYGIPPRSTFTEDYSIYIKEAEFAPFSTEEEYFFSEETIIQNSPLVTYIQDFIMEKYEGNCISDCEIPLKINSLANQELTIDQVTFKFQPQGTGITSNNKIYNINQNWPRINMDFQAIPLNILNITAPEQERSYTLTFKVGSSTGTSNFRVEPVPIISYVQPTTVIPNQLTDFQVSATSTNSQIVSYTWEWGDGSQIIETTNNTAQHTYSPGIYTLIVKAKDSNNMIGSKSFIISSNVTKPGLNATILNLIEKVNNILLDYNSIDSWYRSLLEINLTQINSTLHNLKQQLPSSNTQQQLTSIKSQLDSINLPLNITETNRLFDSPYYPNLNNINPLYIKELSGGQYTLDQREQYQNEISLWQEENLDIKLSGKIKSLIFETGIEDKLTKIDITLIPKNSLGEIYMVVDLPSGISYNSIIIKNGTFTYENLGDAIAFTFSDISSTETISLALPGKQEFSNINLFVSPPLNTFRISTGNGETSSGENQSIIFPVIILVIVVIVVIIILILIWKNKSGGSKDAFENPQDLFTITNYIEMGYQQGKQKKEIQKELLDQGWTKKQINTAFKQYKNPRSEQNPGFQPSFQPPRR